MIKIEEIENVERLETMEKKFGVSLEGVYAEYTTKGDDSHYIIVRGEIQTVNGAELEESLNVMITAYNANGKILATSDAYFHIETFFGLSPFEIYTDIIEKPVKIKIYPIPA